MPTSITKHARITEDARLASGASSRVLRRARKSFGFTLLEILVVLIILAVLISAVSVNLTTDSRQALREEAVRLAALITQAHDEAITTGRSLAWQTTDNGYRFLQRAPDRSWQPVADDPTLRARALPAGVSLAGVELPMRGAAAEPLIMLSPTGIHDPFRITLALGNLRVRVSSDGANAPIVEDSVQ